MQYKEETQCEGNLYFVRGELEDKLPIIFKAGGEKH